jgi:hypothetical protein
MYERVVYCSTATAGLNFSDIKGLGHKAKKKNQRLDICGALLYGQGLFLQVIEGPPADLDTLMHLIHNDERHTDVHTILRDEVSSRLFDAWSMNIIFWEQALTIPSAHELIQAHDLTSFNPYEWSPRLACKILLALSKDHVLKTASLDKLPADHHENASVTTPQNADEDDLKPTPVVPADLQQEPASYQPGCNDSLALEADDSCVAPPSAQAHHSSTEA